MTEHTPGPWDWLAIGANASGGFHLYVIDSADRKIAALWGKAAEKQSNAQLIAAAPVMLAALKELAKMGREGMKPDYTEWLTFHDKVALIAESAIESATVTESGPSAGNKVP